MGVNTHFLANCQEKDEGIKGMMEWLEKTKANN